ncbi:MAG: HTH domain-containing protein [Acidimicrobiales bacterium]|nr:HTH domain-containing protein [Acidimicrobiales bacterium]
MRAGRLLRLVLALQDGRRHTSAELAERLQVSVRTVLRDLDTLSTSGVPVYATRGPGGGFQLLDTFRHTDPAVAPGLSATRGPLRRVRVRLSPSALQVALVHGRPEGWRPRPHPDPPPADRPDWIEGTFRFDSYDTARRELLALGPDIEVLLPVELRATMAAAARRLARLHRG